MEGGMRGIAQIVAEKDSFPLNVRVIRKYVPFTGKQKAKDRYFLLTDKNGDAIEVMADVDDRAVDRMLEIGKCYTLDNFICHFNRTYEPVIPHPACIVLSSDTTIVPISDDNIPTYHYEFANHQVLEDRKGKNGILSDYLGRVERASGIITRGGKTMMKIVLLDEGAYFVEVTLWEQKAYDYLNRIPVGKIIAITSAKVTDFEGNVQLESTAVTAIDIDPRIPDLAGIYERLRTLRGRRVMYQGYTPPNVMSIAEILSKNPADASANRFTCKAYIKEIEAYRGWYNKSCPQCSDRIFIKMGVELCRKGHPFVCPKYRYCINAVLIDDTGSLAVTFFDEAATELMEVECQDLVVRQGFTDSKKLPPAMAAKVQRQMTFRLRLRINDPPAIISVIGQQQDQ